MKLISSRFYCGSAGFITRYVGKRRSVAQFQGWTEREIDRSESEINLYLVGYKTEGGDEEVRMLT